MSELIAPAPIAEPPTQLEIEFFTLDFSQNWNNKLFCGCFLTFRRWNDLKYRLGAQYSVRLNDEELYRAVCVHRYGVRYEFIPDALAWQDVGQNAEGLRHELRRIWERAQAGTLFAAITLQRIPGTETHAYKQLVIKEAAKLVPL